MLSEKQKRPKVKEFAKFLVLSEGKLSVHLELDYNQKLVRIPDKYFFLSVKVWKIWFVGAILTFWAFCFNILQGRHAQKKSCCKSHSYLGTFIDAQWNFYFWERWLCKIGRASRYLCCGISLQHLCFWTPPFKLSLKRLSSHMFRNRLFCTWPDLCCFNSMQVFQKTFYNKANCGKPIARHFSRILRQCHPVMLTYTF